MGVLTKWFPPEVKPVHEGVHETKGKYDDSSGFQYWNGQDWRYFGHDADDAYRCRGRKSFFQNVSWRGLAEKPSQKEKKMTTTCVWHSIEQGRPTDHTKKYLVMSNWGIRMARLHEPQWANGEFQDAESDNDEGMYDWDEEKGPFTVTHWMDLPEPPVDES